MTLPGRQARARPIGDLFQQFYHMGPLQLAGMTFLRRPKDHTPANTPSITKSPAAVHATRSQGCRRLHAKNPHEAP
eukprot:5630693-Karenia_brevis.AAC.1